MLILRKLQFKTIISVFNIQPKKIQDYDILEELGQGSYGVVYKGKDKSGKVVAIKQLLANVPKEKKAYHQGELDVIDLKLKHDNIVIVYGYFTPQDSSVKNITIAMELCEAGDLSQYYLSNNPDVATRYNFMLDMAKGVGYLHNHGIVHRDLKPENVLLKPLDTRLVCKISDFGISKIQQRRDDVCFTQIGSFAYMAPEIMDHHVYSKPVDVFALGLLFFVAFKQSILANYFGEKALIPGYLDQQNRIMYFNSDIHKEKLNETSLLASHFAGSEQVGNLILSMIKANPDKRCEMEHVLVEITDVRARNQMEENVRQLRDSSESYRNDTKTRMAQQQSYIKALEKQRNQLQAELQNVVKSSEEYKHEMEGRVAKLEQTVIQQKHSIEDLEMQCSEFRGEVKTLNDTLEKYKTDLSIIRQKWKVDQDKLLGNKCLITDLKNSMESLKKQNEMDCVFLENNIKQLQTHLESKTMLSKSRACEKEQEEKEDIDCMPYVAEETNVSDCDPSITGPKKEILHSRLGGYIFFVLASMKVSLATS